MSTRQLSAPTRDPDRACGKTEMQQLIDTLVTGVPAALLEIRTLDRTLNKRCDILACFHRPSANNGPTEAINGRDERALREKQFSIALQPAAGQNGDW